MSITSTSANPVTITASLKVSTTRHALGSYAASFSPDGQHVAASSLKGPVKIWDVGQGTLADKQPQHTQQHPVPWHASRTVHALCACSRISGAHNTEGVVGPAVTTSEPLPAVGVEEGSLTFWGWTSDTRLVQPWGVHQRASHR